ncbi:SOUL family heme-binding protein [Halalkalicoccus jeotgali]|uniref:SOUL heme-binding protein n=1 Tax=Halalkalicoccus jeotgali (strain DSM 18796 / CECT 7217 / JCM 14584 / KCTC 4019 / B3) TaxID=795797 RepID=D8JAN5_HALJB|nr:heme-binding protein [Halalkalicoccus jeotgali]ADJ14757.1 SOUL heme-binding protein [Halalkalicoccus jeotgali B3]ELY39339.1 SOUL heme-binding protein [Halalkalicoccus jeotgali B3]
MNRRTVALAAGIALFTAVSARRLHRARAAERVPYEVLDRFDGVELRRYPPTIAVETTAPDERVAFGRLFEYISGANERREEIAMTAPVRTDRTEGVEIPMTAPVRTTDVPADGSVRMAFYLPSEYDPEDAPLPTDPSVRLVVDPERTLGIASFSWYATEDRTRRITARLADALADRGIATVGEPVLLRYDPPLTPPFMRTNEVAVVLEDR